MNPLSALEPERTPECISDLGFDRWLAGETNAEEMLAREAHLRGCARCRERRKRLLSEQVEWHIRATPKQRKPAAKRALYAAAAGALAMAAAALLIVRSGPELDTVRSKGGRSIGFYVKHGEHVRRGGEGEVVAPGDALRFVYTSDARRYFAVLSVDGAQRASIYYPTQAPRQAASIQPGRDVPLPLSTVLDDVLGDEVLIGVFCDAAIDLEPMRRALEANPQTGPPPGCVFDRLSMKKEADR